MTTRLLPLILLVAVSALSGCGNSSTAVQSKPTKERFDEAMAELADEDYERAAQLFDIIVTQDPAGDLADDAQFYLGEAHFLDENYRLAMFNYRRLLNSFPSSPFYKRAMFRSAESALKLSPQFERDQTDTDNAIKQFRVFIDLYPADSLSGVAREHVASLRNKLAQKEMAVATQYVKLQEYKSALVYFQKVIDLYPDTDSHRPAINGKVDMLNRLGRSAEAAEEVQKFRDANPGTSLNSQ